MNFYEQPGPARVVMQCKTVLDFFMLFLTANIWSDLVIQTNLYYAQSIASHPSSMPWQDTTVNESQAFIGIVIATGVIRLTEVDDYWSTDSILCQHPWFSALMSRTRFRQILRYFHVADNTLAKTDDKLDPLLIGSMLHFCRCIMYTPSQCLSVDESMVGTNRRISFLQYMPKKQRNLA